ncbi:hypothetical protein LCM20_03330 [Halobacillus litoralis]|uniref:alpha-amylase family glycosyl hydrolase n=1 Tax=Halobacillus litoralis TaxID=45668 RepID=UPI001CD1F0D9|nr:alpha-amylase family glycosyl hydrolase [Halobacillus litoralis]MCA0969624.1 hypothetical protein [Halobacillus litoralis]
MKSMTVCLSIILMFVSSFTTVSAASSIDRQWESESVYKIQIDRFMNGDNGNDQETSLNDPEAYHGGDLQGVTDQLDYIKELGFTTIQLSPVTGSADFGGLAVDDFRSVEERFGTMETLQGLVEEANERDMRVVLDFVIKDVSPEHPWLDDASKEEWFLDRADEGQSGLHKLDTKKPEVQAYMQETAEYWAQETGVDGFRLIGDDVDAGLYQSISQAVPEEFFLYTNQQPSEASVEWLDGVMVPEYQQMIRETFQQFGQPMSGLNDLLQQAGDEEVVWLHAIDDETNQRFTHLAVEQELNPTTRWKLALTYLFTSPGIPVMNYGTEVPLDDGGTVGNIRMMNFKLSDEQIKERIENVTSMRQQYPALAQGDFNVLHEEDGLTVFERTYEEQSMIVAINNAPETKVAVVDHLGDGQQLRGLLQDGIVRQQSDGSYRIAMERETADVFVVEEDGGYNWLFIGFVGGVLGLFVIAVTAISIKNRKE